MATLIDQRRAEFTNGYEYQEVLEVRDIITSIATLLESVFGQDVAGDLMIHAYRRVIGDPEIDFQDMSESTRVNAIHQLWNEASVDALSKVQLAQILEALHGYAFYGLPVPAFEAEPEKSQFETLCRYRRIIQYEIYEYIPESWDLPASRRTMEAALARSNALDEIGPYGSPQTIHISELASLAGVSEKTVRNLIAPASGSGLRVDAKGGVPIGQAKQWLESRRDFRSSVWHLVENPGPITPEDEDDNPVLEDEVLFVPIARDGSAFTPELKRNGGFTIGRKGGETKLSDYRLALRRLQEMQRPTWRRPNEAGHWGLVTATHWERKTAGELGLARRTDDDLPADSPCSCAVSSTRYPGCCTQSCHSARRRD